MKKSGHGPVPTKGTKCSENDLHILPPTQKDGKGYSYPVGSSGSRSKENIVDRKEIHPKVTKHGFLANEREYE